MGGRCRGAAQVVGGSALLLAVLRERLLLQAASHQLCVHHRASNFALLYQYRYSSVHSFVCSAAALNMRVVLSCSNPLPILSLHTCRLGQRVALVVDQPVHCCKYRLCSHRHFHSCSSHVCACDNTHSGKCDCTHSGKLTTKPRITDNRERPDDTRSKHCARTHNLVLDTS